MYFNTVAPPENTFSQAKNNFFQSNNQTGGGGGENGIYTDFGSVNVYIDSNKFTGHKSASINFSAGTQSPPPVPIPQQSNIVISNNEMESDNSITLANTTNVKITGNRMNNTQGSSIFIAGGTNLTEIEENVLHNSVSNGIYVNLAFSETPNMNIRAKNNSIQGNASAGLRVDSGAYAVSPRRLDATNNWWGSPTGPANAANPGGTGDAVIDNSVETVVEFVPFLRADPIGPSCEQLLADSQASLAATQAQLVASQASLAATQAQLAASQAALAAAQAELATRHQRLEDISNGTTEIKKRAIRRLRVFKKKLREAEHYMRTGRLQKSNHEMRESLSYIRKAMRTIRGL